MAGGLNTYAYVGGNPLIYVDPLGLRGGCPANMRPGRNGICEFEPNTNNRKECADPNCSVGLPPNPNIPPQTECEIACNIKFGPACIAAGAAGKAGGGVAGGVAVGAVCNTIKYLACKADCENKNSQQCPTPK